jgi:hypothetical protein
MHNAQSDDCFDDFGRISANSEKGITALLANCHEMKDDNDSSS